MESRQKVRAFSAFDPYVRMMQAFQVERFQDKPISLKIRQISYTLGETMVIVATPLLIFLAAWHMTASKLSTSEFSTSFAILLTFVQMLLIGVTVVAKKRLISGALDDIQAIVDERRPRNPNQNSQIQVKKISRLEFIQYFHFFPIIFGI